MSKINIFISPCISVCKTDPYLVFVMDVEEQMMKKSLER